MVRRHVEEHSVKPNVQRLSYRAACVINEGAPTMRQLLAKAGVCPAPGLTPHLYHLVLLVGVALRQCGDDDRQCFVLRPVHGGPQCPQFLPDRCHRFHVSGAEGAHVCLCCPMLPAVSQGLLLKGRQEVLCLQQGRGVLGRCR